MIIGKLDDDVWKIKSGMRIEQSASMGPTAIPKEGEGA